MEKSQATGFSPDSEWSLLGDWPFQASFKVGSHYCKPLKTSKDPPSVGKGFLQINSCTLWEDIYTACSQFSVTELSFLPHIVVVQYVKNDSPMFKWQELLVTLNEPITRGPRAKRPARTHPWHGRHISQNSTFLSHTHLTGGAVRKAILLTNPLANLKFLIKAALPWLAARTTVRRLISLVKVLLRKEGTRMWCTKWCNSVVKRVTPSVSWFYHFYAYNNYTDAFFTCFNPLRGKDFLAVLLEFYLNILQQSGCDILMRYFCFISTPQRVKTPLNIGPPFMQFIMVAGLLAWQS